MWHHQQLAPSAIINYLVAGNDDLPPIQPIVLEQPRPLMPNEVDYIALDELQSDDSASSIGMLISDEDLPPLQLQIIE